MIELSGKIAGLWRHPIKGFAPEHVDQVTLTANAFFPCDRLYAIEVGASGYQVESPQFLSKMKYAVLARFPAIAALKTRYDAVRNVFEIQDQAYALDTETGRHRLCRHIETVLSLHEDFDPAETPLRLLSIAPEHHPGFRFTDSSKGFVSLLNLNSLRDLETRSHLSLDPMRFRANIWLEGLDAFEDHDWVGRHIHFGEYGPVLEGLKPIERCIATHVNLKTGKRDADVCPSLWTQYGHRNLGLYARVLRDGSLSANI